MSRRRGTMAFDWDKFRDADHAQMFASWAEAQYKTALLDLHERVKALEDWKGAYTHGQEQWDEIKRRDAKK